MGVRGVRGPSEAGSAPCGPRWAHGTCWSMARRDPPASRAALTRAPETHLPTCGAFLVLPPAVPFAPATSTLSRTRAVGAGRVAPTRVGARGVNVPGWVRPSRTPPPLQGTGVAGAGGGESEGCTPHDPAPPPPAPRAGSRASPGPAAPGRARGSGCGAGGGGGALGSHFLQLPSRAGCGEAAARRRGCGARGAGRWARRWGPRRRGAPSPHRAPRVAPPRPARPRHLVTGLAPSRSGAAADKARRTAGPPARPSPGAAAPPAPAGVWGRWPQSPQRPPTPAPGGDLPRPPLRCWPTGPAAPARSPQPTLVAGRGVPPPRWQARRTGGPGAPSPSFQPLCPF